MNQVFLCVFLAFAVPAPSALRIRNIQVEGNQRVPSVSISREVSARPGTPFDAVELQGDLRKLYRMGYFSQVETDSKPVSDGEVDVVIRVREFPLVSAFVLEGADEAMQAQIQDYLKQRKIEIRTAAPFHPWEASNAAAAVRDFLRMHKYPNAEVRVEPETEGPSVRVKLSIHTGPALRVGRVLFSGNSAVSSDELLKQMQYARPATFIGRWKGQGSYVPVELASDIERIRRYYQSRGFASAVIGKPEIEAFSLPGSTPKLQIRIPLTEGSKYRITSILLEGDCKAATRDVSETMKAVTAPASYDLTLLENTRRKLADALGHHGYGLAQVRMEQKLDEAAGTAQVLYSIDTGEPVIVGKIGFQGNRRIPDKFLRRQMHSLEGEVYDSRKLDESLEKLNKSDMVKAVQRSDVSLEYDEERNALDVVFKVREKDRQGIFGTGGTGGMGGGYLGILYTAFNLLRIGETLSLQIDGGAAQRNILLDLVGEHFFGSYFTLALSGFHRFADFNVASIVPGPRDLVKVLRRKTTGLGLSGSYPLTRKIRVGMGFNVARDSIAGEFAPGEVPDGPFFRSEVIPSFSFDATRGNGPHLRGYRLGAGYGLSGSAFLRSIDSSYQTGEVAAYVRDPVSKGRNSYAFHLQGTAAHPRSGLPLLLERRFYPGDEVARGFLRGGLSPWAATGAGGSATLVPAGADTILGFSAEYRVPIRGPLSGAGFLDLGWTRLDAGRTAQFYPGSKLVDATNAVLRASLGGELRLQLPMLRQPARVIFSWNPLRLDAWIKNGGSPLRLVDPVHTIHFALGNIF
jgi:outer membrane protein assembly complex protein YaeT